ncbi:MAG: hypothetical protein JSS78_08900 [Bacteroidetes bacterium]|nr:hypothetical protein [Bacteroidota bacterium]
MIAKLHLQGQKEIIVLGASQQRTTSTKELTSEEAKGLIQYLKKQDAQEQRAETMRRKIISRAHEMRWHTAETKDLPRNYRKVDMPRLDDWMLKSSYLHKKLNQYRYSELPALVTQFEQVYKSFLKWL